MQQSSFKCLLQDTKKQFITEWERVSLYAAVRLLHHELEVRGLKNRNSLTTCNGKVADIRDFLDPAMVGASCIGWFSHKYAIYLLVYMHRLAFLT